MRKEMAWTRNSLCEVSHLNISITNIQLKGKLCWLPGQDLSGRRQEAIAMARSADTSLLEQRKTGREPRVIPVFSLNVAAL